MIQARFFAILQSKKKQSGYHSSRYDQTITELYIGCNQIQRQQRYCLNGLLLLLSKKRQKQQHCRRAIQQPEYRIAKLLFSVLVSSSAMVRSSSPDNNSSIVTPKNLEIAFRESMLGYPLPDSHLETAVRDT